MLRVFSNSPKCPTSPTNPKTSLTQLRTLHRILPAEAELDQLRWAVISYDRCEAGNLTYEAASRLLSELESEGVSGLCIVTDQTAARLAA